MLCVRVEKATPTWTAVKARVVVLGTPCLGAHGVFGSSRAGSDTRDTARSHIFKMVSLCGEPHMR